MKFVFMHGSIVDRDAIGSDIAGMYDVLAGRGHKCFLYGEHIEASGRAALSRDELVRFLAAAENAVVYHQSIFWGDGEELLRQARARVIFKYHNITPPSFFADFEPYWEACVRGREQTYRLVHRHKRDLWLSDSLFNLAELGIDLLPNRAVAPPFFTAACHAGPDAALLKELIETQTIHVLMVGRFVPNKGHHLFVRVIEAYKERYGGAIAGILIGKLDPVCRSYYDSVLAEADRAGVAQNLRLPGSVSASELLSYFLGSDVYLCCSAHEGFCVPVVEAQSARLPVVARWCGAVQETLGPGQVLLGDDPAAYAEAIHRLCYDSQSWREAVERGYANFCERFTTARIAGDFLGALQGYLGIGL